MTVEPRLHGFAVDGLLAGHRDEYVSIYCGRCNQMLHASNNEAMVHWVETGLGDYCLPCFLEVEAATPLAEDLALESADPLAEAEATIDRLSADLVRARSEVESGRLYAHELLDQLGAAQRAAGHPG